MMDAVSCLETSVILYETTWHDISEDIHLQKGTNFEFYRKVASLGVSYAYCGSTLTLTVLAL
jgi:hypothetical protein